MLMLVYEIKFMETCFDYVMLTEKMAGEDVS